MGAPTYDDANVMLQATQIWTDQGLGEVAGWIWSEDFPTEHDAFLEEYPLGSDGYRDLVRYAGYFETLGTLWKHGLFNEDLLFDWLLIPWERVSNIVLGERDARGVKRLWENFEALGERQNQLFG